MADCSLNGVQSWGSSKGTSLDQSLSFDVSWNVMECPPPQKKIHSHSRSIQLICCNRHWTLILCTWAELLSDMFGDGMAVYGLWLLRMGMYDYIDPRTLLLTSEDLKKSLEFWLHSGCSHFSVLYSHYVLFMKQQQLLLFCWVIILILLIISKGVAAQCAVWECVLSSFQADPNGLCMPTCFASNGLQSGWKQKI
jgi:hypothetical protein